MFPILKTDRFILQEIHPEDQTFIYQGLSHPEVIPYYGVSYSSFAATATQMNFYNEIFENGTGIWWKIVDQQTANSLGAIGYNNYEQKHNKAEIGYWLLPKFWKQGIISEVLTVVIQFMKEEKGINQIEALIEDENKASCRVLEKAGFKYEGKMWNCEMKNGRYISLLIYSFIVKR